MSHINELTKHLEDRIEELESRLLDEAVRRSEGNLSGAARLLGITRPQLQYRLKKKDNA